MEHEIKARNLSGDKSGESEGGALQRAAADRLHPLLALQRQAGNQAVQRSLTRSGDHPQADVRASAEAGTRGQGQQLPYLGAIQASFGAAHDLSGIQAHMGPDAAKSAQAMGADGFATGNHVAFRSYPTLELAAHEAAHVVQQSAGVHASQGIGRRGDAYERHADAVAQRVTAGQPAEDLLLSPIADTEPAPLQKQDSPDGGAPVSGPPPAAADGGNDSPPATDATAQVLAALSQKDPIGGVGDFSQAFSILNGLAMFDMVKVLDALQRSGNLEILRANLGAANGVDVPRLQAAISTVWLAHSGTGVVVKDVIDLVHGLQNLPPDQRQDILSYVLAVKGGNIDRESLVALVTAIPVTNETASPIPGQVSSANTPPASFPASAAGAAGVGGVGVASGAGGAPPTPVQTSGGGGGGGGGGAPPRRPQPPQLRIGNLAHRLIAGFYRQAHAGDVVFTNYYGMKRLILEIGALHNVSYNVAALTEEEQRKKPDISNLSRPHLYEIKPAALAGLAAAEAAEYIAFFAKAGVVMPPGPAGEPGTSGKIPIPPIGFFSFDSPEPGVILYGLRVRMKEAAAAAGANSNTGSLTGAQEVGLVILAVGVVAAAVLLTIFIPPAGIAVDELLIEGTVAAGTGEAALGTEAAVVGADAVATTAVASESAEVLELKSLLDLELAGVEAANDNALVDIALDEASGF